MRDRCLVFISSVMNPTIDDMTQERAIASEAIKSIGDVAEVWAFEYSPASGESASREYLSKVEECDIFVLLLGRAITIPVRSEYALAIEHGKPILVFLREDDEGNHSAELMAFLERIRSHLKYARFSQKSLHKEVLAAIRHEILLSLQIKQKLGLSTKAVDELRREHFRPAIEVIHRNLRPHWSIFVHLRRGATRTPLEMIKDTPHEEELLPIMAAIPRIDSLEQQVKYLRERGFSKLYRNSWVDLEVQLIGAKVLEIMPSQCRMVRRFYDAGSGNCGQLKAFLCVFGTVSNEIEYIGQDYNPEWEASIGATGGRFVLRPLPEVETVKVDLVACTHVLQDQVSNPLSMYACMLSFNNILIDHGLCYVTVPVKDAYPGLLDALELSASEAGFHTVKSGRFLLKHSLTGDGYEPRNFTSFDYLILKKKSRVDQEFVRSALGLSFLRWQNGDRASSHDVEKEADVPWEIRLVERELREILTESRQDIRTFRLVARRLLCRWGYWSKFIVESVDAWIRDSMRDVYEATVGSNEYSPDAPDACLRHLAWLIIWFFVNHRPISRDELVLRVFPLVEDSIRSPREIRVQIGALTDEQVARLIRHIFEFCQSERIDLSDAIQRMPESRLATRKWLIENRRVR